MTGRGERHHADRHPFHFDQMLNGRLHGGAGGQHVVADQHMLVAYYFRILYGEHLLHIFPAVEAALLCLCVGEMGAHQHVIPVGDAHTFRQAHGDPFALVVASLALFAGVQGDGQDAVHTSEASLLAQLLAVVTAQVPSNLFLPFVLELMQDVLRDGAFVVEHQGGHLAHGYPSREDVLQRVSLLLVVMGLGQVQQTVQAEQFLVLPQRITTPGTETRIKHRKDIVQ